MIDTIDRVAKLLDGSEPLPAKVTNGMIFLAIKQERDDRLEAQIMTDKKIDDLKEKFEKNPAVRFGEFLQKYPAIAAVMGIMLLTLLAVAVYGGFGNIPDEFWGLW